MKRQPFSASIVCMNEEDRIRECLESVRFADEIVVVDSGSSDNTVSIAREYTERVLHHHWPGMRGQREWAAGQCSHEWVLSLDADERVSPELRAEIESVLARPRLEASGFTMPRKTFYQGRWILHGGWYPDRKLRFYRREAARFLGRDPHDAIEVEGEVEALRGDLLHYTYRDLDHHARRLVSHALVNAESKREAGQRFAMSDLLLRPPFAFFKSYVIKLGLLEGMPGFLIASMMGYYTFLKYARMWEMERESK